MPLLEIKTTEQPVRGDPYFCHYLFNQETLKLISDPEGDARLLHNASEIAKVLGLVSNPHYKQRNGRGWYIISSDVAEVPDKKPLFDDLVRRLSRFNDP